MIGKKGLAAALVLVSLAAGLRPAAADDTETNERCATRLSITLLGEGASDALLASNDPQSQVDALIGDARFVERFASFVNASFNVGPGQKPAEDAAYYLAKHVLSTQKPWKETFVGRYQVVQDPANATTAVVREDPAGLGYFRSPDWLVRYAGNEIGGYKLVTAFRILNNTVGLNLVAVTNQPGADLSTEGRQQAPCNNCHFDNWYALDKVARVLTKVKRQGATVTFTPPTEGPRTDIVDNRSISDDEALVRALVDSEAFDFNSCRLAFQFLYGRQENECEGLIFDRCMEEFRAKGTMQSAVAVIAKQPAFCH
jgi:hypothetical protein